MSERDRAGWLDDVRPLAWSRIGLGTLFLLRTTPLLAPLHLPFLIGTAPLLGWPSTSWHGQPIFFGASARLVAVACVVRTLAALCFLAGYRTRLSGLVAGALGYVVMFQYPFGFNATLHLLFQGTMLLALTDAGAALALRPSPVRYPRSGKLLIRIFLASIYFWAGVFKLRHDWLDGRTLGLFHDNGIISGALADFVLGTPWRRQLVARSVAVVELCLPVLLLWSKTRRFAPFVALGMHASLELAVGPDLLGWEMAALLLCLWPFAPAPLGVPGHHPVGSWAKNTRR